MALTVDNIKRLVLATGDLREQSYDAEARHYRLDEHEAAELAIKQLGFTTDANIARLIGLALNAWWNDTMDWAGDKPNRETLATIPDGFVYPSRDTVKHEGHETT